MALPASNSGPNLITPNTADNFCKLLTEVLGRKVTGQKAPPFPIAARAPRMTAVYTEEERTVAVCICDLAFAAYIGAALMMLPAGAAKDCITGGKCTPELIENLAEILNICRQFFQLPGRPAVAEQLYTTSGGIPEAVAAIVAKPRQRLDLEIVIPAYGNGRFSILV